MTADRDDLRTRLARRQQEKAELERRLHAVRRRFQEEVAPLKEEVLRLRMEQLRRAAQRHMRSAEHRNAYHNAQRAYETFRKERQPPEPADDTLKALYRAAGKQCHPDVVTSAYQEQAAATFQALDAAYQAGHVRAVRAIAEALERWGFPASSPDEQTESETAPNLQQAVADLEADLEALRATEAYQAVGEEADVEAVLRAKKEKLIRILAELRSA